MPTATEVDNGKMISRSSLHSNRWFDHYVDDVVLPDGRHIPEHHVIHFHSGSVGILASNRKDELLMVKVWRHPLERYEWEIPAGGMEKDESAIEAAMRELIEETGFVSAEHLLVYSFNPLNAISDKVFHIVSCNVTSEAEATDDEVTEIRWFSREELARLIKEGDIRDGLSLTALLLAGIK